LLVHICCSIDSHFFLQKIQKDYLNEEIIGFFYNPNIHPYSEYKLRLLDVQYSCNILGIKLIKGEYDYKNWINTVKGYEEEPEKGKRCTLCYDKRLEITALKTIELNHTLFTTTLLISPLKSQEKLRKIGENLSLKYNLNFQFFDYRGGQNRYLQIDAVKNNSLYRQNYCGCLYALNMQRDCQKKLCDELLSPINNQILPESIESRIELYTIRNQLRKEKKNYKIVKKIFLNYRLLTASVKINKKIVPSYFICYSTLQNKKIKGKIEYTINHIHYLNKNGVKLMNLNIFNKLNNTNYNNIKELMWSPLNFDDELKFRTTTLSNTFDLSTLIILDTISYENIEIICNSKVYEDVKEEIIDATFLALPYCK
jgi:predicted adenine nucleotide alpha hydrolase (AANH) superfamily ATPase